MENKNKIKQLARRRIFIESLVAFLIVLSPFIFKSHEYFTDDASVETITFLGIEIGKNGFQDIATHIWFIVTKFVPLYLMLIWFLTCKHWWYHIILIPMLMYTLQLFELYLSEGSVVDSQNLIWILPICIVIIPFVYFIRLKLYDKHVHGIDLDAMDEELTILKAKEELRKEREKLEQRQKTLEKKM